jgi:hypothetical protein
VRGGKRTERDRRDRRGETTARREGERARRGKEDEKGEWGGRSTSWSLIKKLGSLTKGFQSKIHPLKIDSTGTYDPVRYPTDANATNEHPVIQATFSSFKSFRMMEAVMKITKPAAPSTCIEKLKFRKIGFKTIFSLP